MKLENRNILVVGAGKSGLACARFLKKRGARVTVNDVKPATELAAERDILSAAGIPFVSGGHEEKLFREQEVIVVSPGVPHDTAPFAAARERGIEIVGELELAARFVSTPIVAITGTNGKTTTTTLVGEILRDNGLRVFVGGNIGTPFIDYADDDSLDLAVLEVSSFQLETVHHFHPFGAVVLNITPDHLDRYPGMKEYAETKMAIFEKQEAFDFAVVNADDEWVMRYKPGIMAELFAFSTRAVVNKGCWYRDSRIHVRHPLLGNEETIDARDVRLQGIHNMENVMAAVITALELGVPLDVTRGTLSRFAGLHHRLERVDTIKGVAFYNDSKGTNVGAVDKALESFDAPVVLILGGKDKGGGYEFLEKQIRRTVKSVVALGEAKDKIYEQLHPIVPVTRVGSLDDAVTMAMDAAASGDIVLFSPACSSFDMFRNYAERGERFVTAVNKLKERTIGKN